jgi:hypothetical protein
VTQLARAWVVGPAMGVVCVLGRLKIPASPFFFFFFFFFLFQPLSVFFPKLGFGDRREARVISLLYQSSGSDIEGTIE